MPHFMCFKIHHHHFFRTLFHRRNHRIIDSLSIICFYLQTIYYNINIMHFITVKAHSLFNIFDFTINPYLRVTHFLNLLKKFPVMALTTFHFWGEKYDFFIVKISNNQINNLFIRILDHFFACVIRNSGTNSRK